MPSKYRFEDVTLGLIRVPFNPVDPFAALMYSNVRTLNRDAGNIVLPRTQELVALELWEVAPIISLELGRLFSTRSVDMFDAAADFTLSRVSQQLLKYDQTWPEHIITTGIMTLSDNGHPDSTLNLWLRDRAKVLKYITAEVRGYVQAAKLGPTPASQYVKQINISIDVFGMLKCSGKIPLHFQRKQQEEKEEKTDA